MEVTNYELFKVPPRWVFLKIETSTGLTGWGEPIAEGLAETVIAAVEEIMDSYLVGTDPLEIERYWQAIYRGRHFRGGPILMSAMAGIDQALWDIKGKYYDAPLYDLLGGRARDRTQVYQWIGGDTPGEMRDGAATAVENGYRTLKMAPISQSQFIDAPDVIENASDRLAAVRDEVGSGVSIGIDFRGRITKGMAKGLARALDEYDPMFFEEPVPPEYFDAISDIKTHTKTPIASGERLYSRWEFQHVISDGLVDIVQPDPAHAGGITEVKKIANNAETADMAVMLHCAHGPIAFASCLHLSTVVPNAFILSQNLNVHDTDDNELLVYLEDPDVFGFENGYVTIPDRPGLGIDVDEASVREHADAQIDWQNPIWFHDDGSVAEW